MPTILEPEWKNSRNDSFVPNAGAKPVVTPTNDVATTTFQADLMPNENLAGALAPSPVTQPPTTPQPGGTTGGSTGFAGMLNTALNVTAPADTYNTQNTFSDLAKPDYAPTQDVIGRANEVLSSQLAPSDGPSKQSEIARNVFLKSLQEAQRKVAEESALSGRGDTNQLGGDLVRFMTQSAIPQRAELEAQLSAQDQEAELQRQQAGIQNYTALQGMAEQNQQWKAGLISDEQKTKYLGQIGIAESNADRILQAYTNESQQAHDQAMTRLEYDLKSDFADKDMTRQEYILGVQNKFASELQQAGFRQEDAMQLAEIEANKFLTQMRIDADDTMQQALFEQQKYLQGQELSLDRAKLKEDMFMNRETLAIQLKELGLREDQIQSTLESDSVRNSVELATILMEIGGDNPEVQDMASAMIFKAVGENNGMSPIDIVIGEAEIRGDTSLITNSEVYKSLPFDQQKEVLRQLAIGKARDVASGLRVQKEPTEGSFAWSMNRINDLINNKDWGNITREDMSAWADSRFGNDYTRSVADAIMSQSNANGVPVDMPLLLAIDDIIRNNVDLGSRISKSEMNNLVDLARAKRDMVLSGGQ